MCAFLSMISYQLPDNAHIMTEFFFSIFKGHIEIMNVTDFHLINVPKRHLSGSVLCYFSCIPDCVLQYA